MNVNGYEVKTTFWMDFSIAEKCLALEPDAIKDTYDRAFKEWKDNIEYLTELVMVLNWKSWYWDERKNARLTKTYYDLWMELDGYCMDTLQGDDLAYYLATTD